MKENAYDFIIIGGGASSTAIMSQIANIQTDKPFKVLVIEKSEVFGPGFPYSENTVLPDHLVNTAAARLDITRSTVPQFASSDFMEWASKLPAKTLKSYGLPKIERSTTTFFPPRYAVGKYLADRFSKFTQIAQKKKIKVTLLHSTEATRIVKDEEGRAIITLSNGKKVASANVMLATGHWPSQRFNNVKGYFPNPWPASELIKKVPAEDIAIIGSNLGAIDTALTLSTKFGKFSRNTEGKLVFTKNTGAENFGMTMYSNSGQLPEVAGYIPSSPLVYQHVTARNIEKLHNENGEFLPIDGFFKLFKSELAAQAPKIKELIPDIDTITLENFFVKIDEFFSSKDQATKLRDDIKGPKKALIQIPR